MYSFVRFLLHNIMSTRFALILRVTVVCSFVFLFYYILSYHLFIHALVDRIWIVSNWGLGTFLYVSFGGRMPRSGITVSHGSVC